MGEKENVQMVQQAYAAFGRGDIPAILNMVANNSEVTHQGPENNLPWARPYRGREGWGQFFKDLAETLEPLRFEPQSYVSQGDRVVAFGIFRARVKSTGRTFEEMWAMDWVVRNGQAVSCRVYEDTAAVVAAMRK
jgi:hypothetical protein